MVATTVREFDAWPTVSVPESHKHDVRVEKNLVSDRAVAKQSNGSLNCGYASIPLR